MNHLSIIIVLFFCASSCLGMFRKKSNDWEDEKTTINPLVKLTQEKSKIKKGKRIALKKPFKAQSLPEMDKSHSEAKNNKKKSKKMPKSISKKAKSSLKGDTHPLVPPLDLQQKRGRAVSMRELPTTWLTPSSGKNSPSSTPSFKNITPTSSKRNLKDLTPRSLFRLTGKSKSDELLEMKKRKSISPRYETLKKNKKKWWRSGRQQQLDMMLDLVLEHEYETTLANFCVLNAGQEKYQKEGSTRKKILAAGLP